MEHFPTANYITKWKQNSFTPIYSVAFKNQPRVHRSKRKPVDLSVDSREGHLVLSAPETRQRCWSPANFIINLHFNKSGKNLFLHVIQSDTSLCWITISRSRIFAVPMLNWNFRKKKRNCRAQINCVSNKQMATESQSGCLCHSVWLTLLLPFVIAIQLENENVPR